MVRSAAPALFLVLLASAAAADPRWWWSDLRLTATPEASLMPHVIAPGYVSGGAGGETIFVTWAEADPARDAFEIWLTASFDGGCSFCEPTQLTDDQGDDWHPRVAVLGLPTGTWSIAVIFERRDTGEVVIAWDSTHVSYRVPFEQLCPQVTALGPILRAENQYVRFGGLDGAGRWPDISAAGTPAFGHFHATWAYDDIAGQPHVGYAHDLTARGGPGWLLDPFRSLAPNVVIESWVDTPRIAADLATDPDPDTGTDTANRTAVNIAYVRLRDVGPTSFFEVAALRSVDSGATFSADGARMNGPSDTVSDAESLAGPGIGRPALDAAFSRFSTTEPAWVMAAWPTPPGLGDVGTPVMADARFLETPAGPAPNWLSPGDVSIAPSAFVDMEDAPTIALQHRFGTQPTPAWTAWFMPGGTPDVWCRAGVLDVLATPALDTSRYPITPVRPRDSAVSTDVQLTHVGFDPDTFTFPATRSVGSATTPSLDANESGVYAVWVDTRDDNPEIYFKRTDQYVSTPVPRLSAACGPAGDASIDVSFDTFPTCPQPRAGERMARYLVYWRRDPAGGYENAGSPLVIPHDPSQATLSARIGGLLPGTEYLVIVVPEDEARNVSPADFDPTVSPAFPPANERSITTPAPCAPATCLWRSDVTRLLPHEPPREDVYMTPPGPGDIRLQGAAYACPFASGDLEPDAAALDNGVPLSLYQVNIDTPTLRLVKSARTIRFTF